METFFFNFVSIVLLIIYGYAYKNYECRGGVIPPVWL